MHVTAPPSPTSHPSDPSSSSTLSSAVLQHRNRPRLKPRKHRPRCFCPPSTICWLDHDYQATGPAWAQLSVEHVSVAHVLSRVRFLWNVNRTLHDMNSAKKAFASQDPLLLRTSFAGTCFTRKCNRFPQ
jgi:hypothetical protein